MDKEITKEEILDILKGPEHLRGSLIGEDCVWDGLGGFIDFKFSVLNILYEKRVYLLDSNVNSARKEFKKEVIKLLKEMKDF